MFQSLTDIIVILTNLLRVAVPVLAALALLFFFWGMAQFILAADNTEERKKGQDRIIWGLVSLFVIMSVAALVTLLQQTVFGSLGSGAGSGYSVDHTNTGGTPIILPQNGPPPRTTGPPD